MNLISDKNAKCGLIWRCPICQSKSTVLSGSIFNRSKLPVNTILHMIYCWAHEYPCKLVAFECNVSKNAVTDLFQTLRNACFYYVNSGGSQPIGGPGKTVEIDETLISRHKNHRGRQLLDVWIFGGICREDGKVFARVVPDRKSITLTDLIQECILPGTQIHPPSPYTNETVNHSQNFVDPVTGCHTQHIERLWRELKRVKVRYEGIPRNKVESHLCEFVWHQDNIDAIDHAFSKALELISNTNFD